MLKHVHIAPKQSFFTHRFLPVALFAAVALVGCGNGDVSDNGGLPEGYSNNSAANEYLPPNRLGDILAHTEMLGPDGTDTIEFEAPAPGKYEYVCSFPGHYAAGMRGVMTVVEGGGE